MSRGPEDESYFYNVTPQNCQRKVVFYEDSYSDPPKRNLWFECRQIRREFGAVPFLNFVAKQVVTEKKPGGIESLETNFKSNCMRTDCPYNTPVGIRALPLIGPFLRAREKPTDLSRAVHFIKSQKR